MTRSSTRSSREEEQALILQAFNRTKKNQNSSSSLGRGRMKGGKEKEENKVVKRMERIFQGKV